MHQYRLLILMLFSQGLSIRTISQADSSTLKVLPIKLNSDVYKIELSKKLYYTKSARYKNIIIYDNRPDTQRIGVYSYGSKPINRQIKIVSGLRASLGSAIGKNLLDESAKRELFVVVRHLWVSSWYISQGREDIEKYRYSIRSKVELRADVFVSDNGEWQPWLRIDTISYSPAEVYDWGERKFNQLILWFIAQLSDTASPMEKIKKRYSYDSLKYGYAQDYSSPVFSWPKMKKGVYKNFEEFKNNSPSLFDYQIKKERNFSILYLRDVNGSSYYSHKLWGFCDGNTFYKNIGGNYFQLYRSGNSFYVYGSAQPEKRTTTIPLFVPLIFTGLGVIFFDHIEVDKVKNLSVDGFQLFTINNLDGNFQ